MEALKSLIHISCALNVEHINYLKSFKEIWGTDKVHENPAWPYRIRTTKIVHNYGLCWNAVKIAHVFKKSTKNSVWKDLFAPLELRHFLTNEKKKHIYVTYFLCLTSCWLDSHSFITDQCCYGQCLTAEAVANSENAIHHNPFVTLQKRQNQNETNVVFVRENLGLTKKNIYESTHKTFYIDISPPFANNWWQIRPQPDHTNTNTNAVRAHNTHLPH